MSAAQSPQSFKPRQDCTAFIAFKCLLNALFVLPTVSVPDVTKLGLILSFRNETLKTGTCLII